MTYKEMLSKLNEEIENAKDGALRHTEYASAFAEEYAVALEQETANDLWKLAHDLEEAVSMIKESVAKCNCDEFFFVSKEVLLGTIITITAVKGRTVYRMMTVRTYLLV